MTPNFCVIRNDFVNLNFVKNIEVDKWEEEYDLTVYFYDGGYKMYNKISEEEMNVLREKINMIGARI